ncbi:MAG: DUF4276 family protein [Candidatus Latescibacteria bacterium]|nr:DUF4276 family protein [Candidatus Latescibacterota bacterium]
MVINRVIVPIVEGFSEVASVPILVRRILEREAAYSVQVAKSFRVKRNRVVKEGELERAIEQVVRSRSGAGGILVLLDADDDCPAQLGPGLLKRCQAVTQLPVVVVLAMREFEGWFLGAKESLRGVRGIRQDATARENPESIRGAKEMLTKNMQGQRRYMEVDDQPALADRMDLELVKNRCPSFEKFLRGVHFLISEMTRA